MRKEGITPGSSVFDTFEDGIDFAIMTDKSFEDALNQLKQDEEDDLLENPVTEALENITSAEGDEEISITVERDLDPDDVSFFHMDPASIAADDYIEAYQDIASGQAMDVGSMIDIVAGTE